MNWYVHYTVMIPDRQQLVAGPYTADEVIDRRREIAALDYVTNCYVSDQAAHAPGQPDA
jgi:hypothetical protein